MLRDRLIARAARRRARRTGPPDLDPALPAALEGLMLGPRRLRSCCLWADGVDALPAAEEAMLALACARAGIEDGMRVVDAGGGWGAFALWVGERHPSASVVAVVDDAERADWVRRQASRLGLRNVETRQQAPAGRFDVALDLEGRRFVQAPAGAPVTRERTATQRWVVPGRHYERTLLAWSANLEARPREALRLLGRTLPPSEARREHRALRRRLIAASAAWRPHEIEHLLLEP